MSDGVVTAPHPFLVIVEQLGIPAPPIVCDFETRENADTSAMAWAESGFVFHTGRGMSPSETVTQRVRLNPPFRVLVMSRAEHQAQLREIQLNQMRMAQAQAQPPRVIR